MLKLNKEQRQALARKIYLQIEETYIPQREALMKSLEPQINQFCTEIEEFDWDCKYSKTGIKVARIEARTTFNINGKDFQYGSDWFSKGSNVRGNLTKELQEQVNRSFKPTVSTSQIEEDLILESIEATHLDSLIAGLISKYSYR